MSGKRRYEREEKELKGVREDWKVEEREQTKKSGF